MRHPVAGQPSSYTCQCSGKINVRLTPCNVPAMPMRQADIDLRSPGEDEGHLGLTERDFAHRWSSTVHHLQETAARMQTAVNAIPSEPLVDNAGVVRSSLTKQMAALLDHTVALNCLSMLMSENDRG